jgi:replicative DNA helicase
MHSISRYQTRERELAWLTRTAKILAIRYEIPFVYICQLNREIEKVKREPRLADLRDSGAIEQDADVVIFLHPVREEKQTHTIDAIVAKGRNIGKGRVSFTYLPGITKFVPYVQFK